MMQPRLQRGASPLANATHVLAESKDDELKAVAISSGSNGGSGRLCCDNNAQYQTSRSQGETGMQDRRVGDAAYTHMVEMFVHVCLERTR